MPDQTTSALPDPAINEWVIFKHLPKYGWNKVEVAARVLAHSTDGGSVLVSYFSPMCWKHVTKWLERSSIVRVLKPMADAEFAPAST